MKTTIEYEDGSSSETPGTAPTIDVEGDGQTVTLIDGTSMCVSETIPFRDIKRVIFEPNWKETP